MGESGHNAGDEVFVACRLIAVAVALDETPLCGRCWRYRPDVERARASLCVPAAAKPSASDRPIMARRHDQSGMPNFDLAPAATLSTEPGVSDELLISRPF